MISFALRFRSMTSKLEFLLSKKNAAFRHDLRGPNGTIIADLTPRNSAVIEHFLGKSSYGINNQVRSLTLEQDSSKNIADGIPEARL